MPRRKPTDQIVPHGFQRMPDGSLRALTPIDPNQEYTVKEASRYKRWPDSRTYREINEGNLPAYGDPKRVPGWALVAQRPD